MRVYALLQPREKQMTAFELRCLCSGHLVPMLQGGLPVPAHTTGDQLGVFFICPECSHICAIPIPVGSDCDRLNRILYNPEEGEKSSYALAAAREKYDSPAGRKHITDLIIDLVTRHFGTSSGVRLHDFGAGPGDLVHHLRRQGLDANGSDPSPGAVEMARELGNPHIIATQDLPSDGSNYQVIMMHHCLEHVPQPIKALEWCRKLLVSGGLIIVLVPNGMYFPARKLDFNAWHWSGVKGHLHFFSPSSLETALKQADFVDVRATGSTVGLSKYRRMDPSALVEEDTIQTRWLMQAAFPKLADITYGEVCKRLPVLAEKGVTVELLATAAAP